MIHAPLPNWFWTRRTSTATPPVRSTQQRRWSRRPSGLLVSGRDSPPPCGTTSTSNRRGSPWACCCRGFGCRNLADNKKYTPLTMGFVGSVVSTCPQGGLILKGGTMSMPSRTCADMQTGRDCSNYLQSFCGGQLLWQISPGEIPSCGAYIAQAAVACVALPTEYGLTWACAHQKVNKPGGSTCAWMGLIDVYRTDTLSGLRGCEILDDGMGGSVQYCEVQDCDTCDWAMDETTPRLHPVVCCTCPRCTHYNSPCGQVFPGVNQCAYTPVIGDCCDPGTCGDGTYDLISCHDPDTGALVNCGPPPSAGNACSNYCPGVRTGRRYSFIFAGCSNGAFVKGCNPIVCPPDPDNFGDFAMQMAHRPVFNDMGNLIDVIPMCSGDWLQVFCP